LQFTDTSAIVIIARNVTNPSFQKSLTFVWHPDLLGSPSSLSSRRDDEGGGVGIAGTRGIGNIRIFASGLAGADGLEADDKCSELLDCSDYDITISIIDDCVLSEVIRCAWDYSITVSIFGTELVHEDSSPKSQNSFSEIIQSLREIILFVTGLNILYILLGLSYPMKIPHYPFTSNFFQNWSGICA
jgi:hypothetical protein